MRDHWAYADRDDTEPCDDAPRCTTCRGLGTRSWAPPQRTRRNPYELTCGVVVTPRRVACDDCGGSGAEDRERRDVVLMAGVCELLADGRNRYTSERHRRDPMPATAFHCEVCRDTGEVEGARPCPNCATVCDSCDGDDCASTGQPCHRAHVEVGHDPGEDKGTVAYSIRVGGRRGGKMQALREAGDVEPKLCPNCRRMDDDCKPVIQLPTCRDFVARREPKGQGDDDHPVHPNLLKKQAETGHKCGNCANLTSKGDGRQGSPWRRCCVWVQEEGNTGWRREQDGPCLEHWWPKLEREPVEGWQELLDNAHSMRTGGRYLYVDTDRRSWSVHVIDAGPGSPLASGTAPDLRAAMLAAEDGLAALCTNDT